MDDLTKQLLEKQAKLQQILQEDEHYSTTAGLSSSSDPSLHIEIFAGKFGHKGFTDGVLAREALFCNPTSISQIRKTGAVIVSDSGTTCLSFN